MRRIQATDVNLMHPEQPELHHPGKEVAQSHLLLRLQHALPLPSFLDKALNRWQYSSPDVTAVEAMLLALKIATESYFEGPVAVADLAVPFPLAQSGRHLLKSASTVAGFKSVVGPLTAGKAAAGANGFGACWSYIEDYHCNGEDAAQLVLTVNYSRAALTAILWIVESGVFKYSRVLHNVNLGTDALYECQHLQSDRLCYKGLAEALRQIVKMPLEDVESNVPATIGGQVLLGEQATDEHLRETLQQVLQEQAVLMSVTNPEWSNNKMIEPVFAAARGVAEASWQRQTERPMEN